MECLEPRFFPEESFKRYCLPLVCCSLMADILNIGGGRPITGSGKHFFLLTNQLCFPFMSMRQISNLAAR